TRVARHRPSGVGPACRDLRRQDSQGREAARSARRASIHIQVVGECQDRQGARPDNPADAAAARRRGGPVMDRRTFVYAIAGALLISTPMVYVPREVKG